MLAEDPLGRTPLAVAIEMASRSDLHDSFDMNFASVIKQLLDDDGHGASEAARLPLDANGTLPLHRSLRLGLCWEGGVEHVANAFSDALSVPDPATKLVPCLLAAVGDESTVDTIFGLMIKKPDIITSLWSENM